MVSYNGTSHPPLANAQNMDKDDNDKIEYEKPKVAARSPAGYRVNRRRMPISHPVDGKGSGSESAANLLKLESSSSGRPKLTLNQEGGYDRSEEKGPARNGKSQSGPELASSTDVGTFKSKARGFEIVIHPLPASLAREYTRIPPGDEIYRVLMVISTDVPGEAWLLVEFEDGRVDEVALEQLSDYPNGQQALANYRKTKVMGSDPGYYQNLSFNGNVRKRKIVHDSDYDITVEANEDDDMLDDAFDDHEDDEGSRLPRKRRKLQGLLDAASGRSSRSRRRQRNPTVKPKIDLDEDEDELDNELYNEVITQSRLRRATRNSRPDKLYVTYKDDPDELQNDDDEDDTHLVKSDILPDEGIRRRDGTLRSLKRGKPAHYYKHDGNAIAFELLRRSERSNKHKATMNTEIELDEELYADENATLPVVPKASCAKEVFELIADGPFKNSHRNICDACDSDANALHKGLLVYCQGCSIVYHETCLGTRSQREHAVTKVDSQCFVLQCRYCINTRKKKDPRAPSLEVCQACRAKGPACDAFAPRRTAIQEEKLRENNGGEDPVTVVDQQLINNADNVLFRCVSCHCAYHFEHLTMSHKDIAGEKVGENGAVNASSEWRCQHCLKQVHRVETLVAWRPTNREEYVAGQTTLDLSEDDKEYLIKWQSQSYAHCEWKPGPWVYGVTVIAMRNAFPKRNDGENLLPKFSKEEAIPEEYLLADVILDVRAKGSFKFESKDRDLKKILDIDQALMKFEGLDYVDAVWDKPPVYDGSNRCNAFIAAYNEFLNGKHFKFEPCTVIKERLKVFRSLDFGKDIEFEDGTNGPPQQPEVLTGSLMKYQIQGLNWVLNSFYNLRSAVLADEMGLGKTIQVISLMATISLQGPRAWPWLVVVPNAICHNWRREIKQWAPDLRVVCYHGGREPQRLAYRYELFPNGTREMTAHVVVMSYDSAQDEGMRKLFRNVHWIGLVVDEGQRLKNDESLLYGALCSLKVPWRLLLTGTPLQNNKKELFNLLQFIDPSKNAARLDEQYSELNAEKVAELHATIRPYFLRRTKAQVLKFLPSMAQIILPVTMSVLQEKLCKSIMEKKPELIRAIFAKSKFRSNERGNFNNILLQLRKCLAHPFLYNQAVEDKNTEPETVHRNLVEASSKLVLLEQMLPKLQERGHRVLLFSQFLGMLDIVEDFMTAMGYKYQRIDGNMSSRVKQKHIDLFNAGGSEDFAFLLSTRSGGVGINLATADTVIILDPDFNPHQDIQALSRAHRIGQKKKVLCFQLMTKGSVEEKIMQVGRKKMALDHALVESMEDEEGAVEDVVSILKHGAEALFSEDEKEQIRYDSAAIDKLLDRSQMKATQGVEEDGSGDDGHKTPFAYVRVWRNETGQLAEGLEVQENPQLEMSAWDQIIKSREEEAKRLAELNREVLGRGGRRRQAVKYTGMNVFGVEDQLAESTGRTQDTDLDEDFTSIETSGDDETDGDHVGSATENTRASDDLVHEASKDAKGREPRRHMRKQPRYQVAREDRRPKEGDDSTQLSADPNGSKAQVEARLPDMRGRDLVIHTPSIPTTDPSHVVQYAGGLQGLGTHPQIPTSLIARGVLHEPRGISTHTYVSPGEVIEQGRQYGTFHYAQNYVANYGMNYAGNYVGNHAMNYAGNYAGNHAMNYAGNYTGFMAGMTPSYEWDPHPAGVRLSQILPTPNVVASHATGRSLCVARERCTNCQLFHLRGGQCPNLSTEVQLRLALDNVQALSGGDEENTTRNREILQNMIRAKRYDRSGHSAGAPAHSTQASPAQQQQMQQQQMQQQQMQQQQIQQQQMQQQQMQQQQIQQQQMQQQQRQQQQVQQQQMQQQQMQQQQVQQQQVQQQ